MKIVSWNCNGKFREKYGLINSFDADIYVIQECENPEISDKLYRDWAGLYFWQGTNKNKGIAVFAKKNNLIQKLDWDSKQLELFLPVKVNENITLVAVWTKAGKSSNSRYIGQMWEYLQLHKNKLTERTILCGDFNSSKKWDYKPRIANHSDVVKELSELQLESIYHSCWKENQGEETRPTFFLNKNILKPHHIDYAFVSSSLISSDEAKACEVGDSEQWLRYSDHMPFTFFVG